jgi:hypothetical protein
MSEGSDTPGTPPVDEAAVTADPVPTAPEEAREEKAPTPTPAPTTGWANAAIPGLGARKPKADKAGGSSGEDADSKGRNPVVVVVVLVAAIAGVLLWLSLGSSGHVNNSTSDVEYTVLNQVQGTNRGEFHDPSVVKMLCDTPSVWATGKVFTCKGYKAGSTEVAGIYRGVVEVGASGKVAWAGSWTRTS